MATMLLVLGSKKWASPQHNSSSCPIRLREDAIVLWGSILFSIKYQQYGRVSKPPIGEAVSWINSS